MLFVILSYVPLKYGFQISSQHIGLHQLISIPFWQHTVLGHSRVHVLGCKLSWLIQLLAAPWVFMGVELAKAERCTEYAAWLEAEPSPMRVKPPVTLQCMGREITNLASAIWQTPFCTTKKQSSTKSFVSISAHYTYSLVWLRVCSLRSVKLLFFFVFCHSLTFFLRKTTRPDVTIASSVPIVQVSYISPSI